jgi:arabinofuranosyltransferase
MKAETVPVCATRGAPYEVRVRSSNGGKLQTARFHPGTRVAQHAAMSTSTGLAGRVWYGNAVASIGTWPWPLMVSVTAVVALAHRYSALYGGNVVDDAMTSMQYAKQLALGNGLVFNVGQRVEGYTNFAWVLVMTPIYWLASKLHFDFVAAVVNLNVLIAAGALGAAFLILRKWLGKNRLLVWFALGLLVVDNSFTVWAILGLEVHLLALFMLLAIVAVESASRWSWLCLGLSLFGAHLTRPDAGLFCAVILGNEMLEALLQYRRGNRGEALVRSLRAALACGVWIVGYGGYFAWRYRYFGYLMPNT